MIAKPKTDDRLHTRRRDVTSEGGLRIRAEVTNIFRQDRPLNRGWSQEGRRFRAPERAAAIPGTFYFRVPALPTDDIAYPMKIEIGIPRGGTLHVERFQNRFRLGDNQADGRRAPAPCQLTLLPRTGFCLRFSVLSLNG